MANSVSHAALPFPVKGVRYTIGVPFLDADGDPTDPTTPDTERSIDGAAFADCTEEEATVSTGFGYITLTGDEMNGSLIMVNFKSASGPKFTPVIIYPRVLPVLHSGTAQAGAGGSITLAAGAPAYDLSGCIARTTGGTGGGGGSGSQGNQARIITAYNTSTKVATVVPDWETNPSSDTTYEVLLTDLAANAPLGRFLRSTVDERTLDVSVGGEAGMDWANVGSPTTTVVLSGTTVKTATDVETDTQDIQTKIGTPTGASVSADIADVEGKVDDLEGRLGVPSDLGSGASVAANLVDIEAQTDDIGVAGAGLSAIPWNTAWDVEVESEATDALNAYDPPTRAELTSDTSSILSKMLKYVQLILRKDSAISTDNATELTAINADEGSGSGAFANTTDSQEAVRDRGDAAWLTATGFSTHSAADVWAVATRVLTAGTNIVLAKGVGLTGLNDLSAAAVNSEVDTALADVNLDHLVGTATGIPAVPSGTYLDQIMDDGTATYDRTTDSLQALADSGGGGPTAEQIADAVWEEAIADHSGTAGSAAEALNAAGAAGDPWVAALPGAYGAGSAGNILGNNLDAAVSSRATQTSVDTVDNNVDTILADTNELETDWSDGGRLDLLLDAVKVKTDNLPADPADASDLAASFTTVNSTLATLAAYVDTEVAAILAAVDTEVAAIKAKTDNLPAAPAAVGDIPTAADIKAAIFAGLMQGRSYEEITMDIWAVIAGDALADDTTEPTSITYDSPDTTVQVTHSLTPTTRTRS